MAEDRIASKQSLLVRLLIPGAYLCLCLTASQFSIDGQSSPSNSSFGVPSRLLIDILGLKND